MKKISHESSRKIKGKIITCLESNEKKKTEEKENYVP